MNDELKNRPAEYSLLQKTKEFKKLNEVNVYKSLFQIFLEYFGIFCCIFLCIKFWSIPFYLICSLYIASRKHSLGVIMHDGIHYRIAKNKKLNDIITNFLIAYPLIGTLKNARTVHFKHHQNPNTDDDPDWIVKQNKEWIFPQKKLTFLFNIFKYCFGIHVIINFISKKSLKTKFEYFLRSLTCYFVTLNKSPNGYIYIFSYTILAIMLCYLNLFYYFFIFWLLPNFLWLPFLSRLRTICEHFGIEENVKHSYELTRTMYPTCIDKYLLSANWNMTYHIDHHLYPTIPSYNIKKLHDIIKNSPEYKNNAHITKNGYYGVFKECTI